MSKVTLNNTHTVTKKATKGFTIVELLIVVVVIAILAAITIVAYNGISTKAKESSLKSDLRSNGKAIENAKTVGTNGQYPTVWTGADLKQSDGNTLNYYSVPASDKYCIQGVNGSLRYYLDEKGTFKTGNCVRVWASKGTSGGSGNYVVVNTMNFAPGSYQVRCVVDGITSSYNTYSLSSTSAVQLSCSAASSAGSVAAEISGWGVSETAAW